MIRAKTPIALIIILALSILTISVSAEVPKIISYQGRLTDSNGDPVADGNYELTFQLVEHDPMPMGESPLWSSGPQQVSVSDGLFVYYLGSNVSLPAEIFNDDGLDSYFLRIKVPGSLVYLQGTELVTTPFAIRSIYSDTAAYAVAGPGGGSSGWVDDGSVVRLETYTDRVGIGTNSAGEALVVGKDLGSFGGSYIVSGSPYFDDVCGFKLGYNSDNHSTLEWNGDGADFELHTKRGGISYNKTLVAHEGNIGIGTTPDSNKVLHIEKTYSLTTNGLGYGIYANVHNTTNTPVADYLAAGFFNATGENAIGLYARAGEPGGVPGLAGMFYAENGNGIYANGSIRAANFNGDVNIIGNLSKTSGSFKIDHPLDPENKYLQHSFVESPDMMNIYNGNIILDNKGQAIVELPDYFKALNKDFRYQLTAIGSPGPNLYIAQEIEDKQFVIAGGEPGMKVSWQVTGIRQDRWANEHRIEVEVDKPEDEQGYYIAPELYGFGEEKGIDYKLHGAYKDK